MKAHPKLHLVSGKGGVGKTWVAAALARRYARGGARTLLLSFERSDRAHPLFAVRPRHEPVAVEPGLDLAVVEPKAALLEYVRRRMTFSMLYEAALANPLVDRFLKALPIFEELMCLGKLLDLTTDSASPYEQVVFDAPATGHCQILLNVPRVAAATLVAGPIYQSALEIKAMLEDPALTELLVVTLAEETPVRETLELVRYAHKEVAVPCRKVVVNRVLERHFENMDTQKLATTLRGGDADWAEPLTAVMELDQAIVAEQDAQLEALRRGLEENDVQLIQAREIPARSGVVRADALVLDGLASP